MDEAQVTPWRRLGWGAVILLLGLSSSQPASAQMVFNPVFTIGGFYTNNYEYIGEPTKDTEASGYYLGLALPLSKQTRFGSWTAMYSTSYEDFRDVELDNGRHYLNFGYSVTRSQTDRLRLNLRYNYTEDQGNRQALGENQIFLSPRATREFGDVGINWGRKLGGLYNLRLIGRVSTWQYDNFRETVEDPEIEEPGIVPRGLRDRDAYRAGFGLSRGFSRSLRIGVAYGYQHFELADYAEQDVHSYSLTIGYRLGNVFNLGVAAGGFHRTSTNLRVDPGEEGVERERSKSGFQVALNLGKAWRLRSFIIGLRVGHAPNVGGGAQLGTATVSRVGVFLRPGQSRGRSNWSWALYGNWARRDPVSELQRKIENVSLGGNIFYSLGRIMGITLSTFWVDQESQNELNEGKFVRVNMGLAIRPFGATRMASP